MSNNNSPTEGHSSTQEQNPAIDPIGMSFSPMKLMAAVLQSYRERCSCSACVILQEVGGDIADAMASSSRRKENSQ